MKTKILILVLGLVSPLLEAQENISQSEKIDSIYVLQKKTYNEVKNQPLNNKKFGIEINPFRFLFIDKMATFSGSFSLFNVNRNIELVFPVYYQKSNNNYRITEFDLDCHARYFFGKSQNGFYLSAFLRYTLLDGTYWQDVYDNLYTIYKYSTSHRVGAGFGIGYRLFTYKGIYWGTSLSIGRYFTGENKEYEDGFLSNTTEDIILDFEFLKFGWSF